MMEKMTEMKAMMVLLRPFMPWFPSGLYPNITFSGHLKKKKSQSCPAQPYAVEHHLPCCIFRNCLLYSLSYLQQLGELFSQSRPSVSTCGITVI